MLRNGVKTVTELRPPSRIGRQREVYNVGTVRRFAISFSVGVCYDLFCFILKSDYTPIIVSVRLLVKRKVSKNLLFDGRHFMSELVDRIEQAIKEKGSNFKRVERECGLGNGTIKRWGEQSPRLDKLVLVSEYLQISLDYLVFGRSCSETAQENDRNAAFEHLKQEQGLTCDGSPLEDEEADLVAMYRLLPEEQQEDIFDLVHLKYRKHVERKKESIYWTYHNGSSATKSGPAEDAEAQGGTA